MSISIRIKDCIDNHERYVAIMASMPDKELAKKINMVHIQMELAEKKRNTSSLELLEIWHHQIIEARIFKAENKIPDAPNEIELAIADIETFVNKSENRSEILTSKDVSIKKTIKQTEHKEDDNQLSLF